MNPVRRNIKAYVGYQTARNAIAWLPVFFLYMSATLSAAEAIALESIYYTSVVVLEVPSGYLSDRLGRRPTLIVAMLAWTAACVVFASTASFVAFAVAQGLMAIGMALNSGTDEALVYDSLAALDEAHDYLDIESRAQARARLAMAGAALVGGAAALVDLRIAYVLSAVAGLVALTFAMRMVEPPRGSPAAPPLRQLGAVVRQYRDAALRWLLVYAVAMIVFDHVVYMFMQPYLEVLAVPWPSGASDTSATPLAAGVVTAVTLGLAAGASRVAPSVARRLGTRWTLLAAMGSHALIIAAMGLWLHPWVVVLLIFRAAPPALWRPVARGVAQPRLPSSIRATFFSVESLAGRLAFASALAAAAAWAGELDQLTASALSGILLAFAVSVAIAWLGLALFSRALDVEASAARPPSVSP